LYLPPPWIGSTHYHSNRNRITNTNVYTPPADAGGQVPLQRLPRLIPL